MSNLWQIPLSENDEHQELFIFHKMSREIDQIQNKDNSILPPEEPTNICFKGGPILTDRCMYNTRMSSPSKYSSFLRNETKEKSQKRLHCNHGLSLIISDNTYIHTYIHTYIQNMQPKSESASSAQRSLLWRFLFFLLLYCLGFVQRNIIPTNWIPKNRLTYPARSFDRSHISALSFAASIHLV